MYIQSIPMISFLVCRHADGKAFVESPWAIFLRSDLGSAQSILTSLFSLTIIIVRLREIIPSHGRKIQVSEILEFTQIDGYCNKFLWWLVGWYAGSPLVLGKSPLGVGCSLWMCFNMLFSDQMATWLRTWLDQPWDLGAPFVQTKVSQTHIRVCVYINKCKCIYMHIIIYIIVNVCIYIYV